MRHRMRTIIAGLCSMMATASLGCGGSQKDEALAVLAVTVAPEVPSFQRYRFFIVDRQGIPERVFDRSSEQGTLSFGYYLPGISGLVTVRGQALTAASCVVGEGTAQVLVTAGKVSSKVALVIAPVAPDAACGAPADAPMTADAA